MGPSLLLFVHVYIFCVCVCTSTCMSYVREETQKTDSTTKPRVSRSPPFSTSVSLCITLNLYIFFRLKILNVVESSIVLVKPYSSLTSLRPLLIFLVDVRQMTVSSSLHWLLSYGDFWLLSPPSVLLSREHPSSFCLTFIWYNCSTENRRRRRGPVDRERRLSSMVVFWVNVTLLDDV